MIKIVHVAMASAEDLEDVLDSLFVLLRVQAKDNGATSADH